ncbi:MAG TPA: hypothetical protein VHB47_12460 [Thermoanaerobaculia bacterium]|jgi:N-acetylglucosamine-6-phosphate deacetylase|nr:hypothetical protein [Thermoanaerobaculia bacterium]
MDLSALEPIDFHCHGCGPFDFAKPHEVQLDEIEMTLTKDRIFAVLTLFVPHGRFIAFEDLCRTYGRKRRCGELKRILGIASEGPLLASAGGTPEKGSWLPTKVEWQRFAALGEHGFRYSVLSPDFDLTTSSGSQYPKGMEWIVDALLSNGVSPALGHFLKTAPEHSAACARRVFDRVEQLGQGLALTDHLYNDMPLNFKHAWRTQRERESRAQDLVDAGLDAWSPENLDAALGVVPATLIRAAWDGLAKICLNFDGAHVDSLICKRTVELVGAGNLMLMTDCITGDVLAGEQLTRSEENSLLYQRSGIVAGGSCPASKQVENMIAMGLEPDEIAHICYENAIGLLGS